MRISQMKCWLKSKWFSINRVRKGKDSRVVGMVVNWVLEFRMDFRTNK